MLVKIMNLSRNVQVSCPLVELRDRLVEVFEVKIPQISSHINLLMTLWRASPSGFLPQIETLLIAHASFLTHLVPCGRRISPDWRSFFLLRNCVGTLCAAADSRFSFINSVLDLRCTRGLSSSSSETIARSGRTRDLSSSSSSSNSGE